jgi:riboflavin synthase
MRACPTVTTLGFKQVNDPINLEYDLIGIYVERLLQERGQLPKPPSASKQTICGNAG